MKKQISVDDKRVEEIIKLMEEGGLGNNGQRRCFLKFIGTVVRLGGPERLWSIVEKSKERENMEYAYCVTTKILENMEGGIDNKLMQKIRRMVEHAIDKGIEAQDADVGWRALCLIEKWVDNQGVDKELVERLRKKTSHGFWRCRKYGYKTLLYIAERDAEQLRKLRGGLRAAMERETHLEVKGLIKDLMIALNSTTAPCEIYKRSSKRCALGKISSQRAT